MLFHADTTFAAPRTQNGLERRIFTPPGVNASLSQDLKMEIPGAQSEVQVFH